MHTDLSLACSVCGLRLPGARSPLGADAARCELCGRPLDALAVALRKEAAWRKAPAGSQPVREVLLWVPVLLGGVLAVAWAVSMALETVAPLWVQPSGGLVALGAMAFFAALAGGSIFVALAWLPWAGLVVLGASFVGRGGGVLVPVPVPSLLRPAPAFRRPWNEANEWLVLRKWRIGLGAAAALGVVELTVEVVSPGSVLHTRQAFSAVAVAVLGQVVMGGFLVPMAYGTLTALRYALDQLVLVVEHQRGARSMRASTGDEAIRETLTRGRTSVTGAVEPLGEGIVAPLSGRLCVAFRLRGRVGPVLLDDGGAAPFVVRTGEGAVVVRAQQYAVALPAPATAKVVLGSTQRARFEAWMQARGLSIELDDVEAGEECLVEGDVAQVAGAPHAETDPNVTDYRTQGVRTVLDDADGKPVLVTSAAREAAAS